MTEIYFQLSPPFDVACSVWYVATCLIIFSCGPIGQKEWKRSVRNNAYNEKMYNCTGVSDKCIFIYTKLLHYIYFVT